MHLAASAATAPNRLHWLPALGLTALLGACSSVNLGTYSPPPVHMPGTVPVQPAPGTPVHTQPVQPGLGQALPPTGAVQPPPVASGSRAHLVTLTSRATGASVLPANNSRGMAQIDLLYDSNTGLLRWKTRWGGFTSAITGAQFHGQAYEGQNGPVVMTWPAPFGSTYEGRATLTPEQANDLLSGRWYLNVMTRNFPAGEIRGQLRVVQ